MDEQQKIDALYEKGAAHETVPDGLALIGNADCGLCKRSMLNNDYAEQTKNGTRITWLNLNIDAANIAFYGMPGIAFENDTITAAGQPIAAIPAVLWIEKGEVKRPAVKYGEVAEGGFELILEKIATQA